MNRYKNIIKNIFIKNMNHKNNSDIDHIIIYGNYFVKNESNIETYSSYLEKACTIYKYGMQCIPNKQDIVQHMVGSVSIENDIFQFRIRMKNINDIDTEMIIDDLYLKGFFYCNYYNTSIDTITYNLECFNTFHEQKINKLYKCMYTENHSK